jgi:hypothetical protein
MPGTDGYRVLLEAKERRELFAPLNSPFPDEFGDPADALRDRYLEETADR